MHNHVGIQVTARPGIDLLDRHTGGGDPTGIVIGLLITLNHRAAVLAGQVTQGPLQQRGLAGTGGRDQIQHQDSLLLKQGAIKGGQPVVLGQDILFNGDLFAAMGLIMAVLVGLSIIMQMIMVVMLITVVMIMVVGVRMTVALVTVNMFMFVGMLVVMMMA
jgi:hypothetical protein